MHNTNIPNDLEVPSTARLVKSTVFAIIVAATLLITVVMPAEYGIDPTGIGKMTGLQKMGEIKMSLAREAADERTAKQQAIAEIPQAAINTPASPALTEEVVPAVITDAEVAKPALALRKDETIITLQADEANEVKVELKKGEVVNFVWFSDAGKANFDIHGDSKTLDIDYHGYSKGSSIREEGTIEAAFDGAHGWFWRNRSGAPLTITLQTEGPYTAIKRIK